MPEVTFVFPLKGKDENLAYTEQMPLTSPYMLNVRPYDTQDKRARGGQRPGLRKLYTAQIGSAAARIDALCQITTIPV